MLSGQNYLMKDTLIVLIFTFLLVSLFPPSYYLSGPIPPSVIYVFFPE